MHVPPRPEETSLTDALERLERVYLDEGVDGALVELAGSPCPIIVPQELFDLRERTVLDELLDRRETDALAREQAWHELLSWEDRPLVSREVDVDGDDLVTERLDLAEGAGTVVRVRTHGFKIRLTPFIGMMCQQERVHVRIDRVGDGMSAIERISRHPHYALICIAGRVLRDTTFDRATHEGVFHVSGGLDRLLTLRLVAFHDRATDVVAFVFRKPADMFREVHDCLLIHDEVIRIREDFLEQRVTPIILLSRFRFQIETVDMRCERAWAIYRRQNCDVIDRRRFSLLKELLRTPRQIGRASCRER